MVCIGRHPTPGNLGVNASAALQALEALADRLPVSMHAVRQGLIEVDLPGRFQVLPGRPAVVLDVAHNPEACAVLADGLGNRSGAAVTLTVGKIAAAQWPPHIGVGGGRSPGPFGQGAFPP